MKDSSLTDWIEAIAAALGAIGLVWTLALQRKTTNEQIKIRQIEQERDKRAILPYFTADIEHNEFLSSGPHLHIKLTLKNNPVTLAVFDSIPNQYFKIHLTLDASKMYPEESTRYPVEYLTKGSIPYLKIMKVRFSDTGLNFYFQDVFLSGGKATITYPELDYEGVTNNSLPSLSARFKDFRKEVYEIFKVMLGF